MTHRGPEARRGPGQTAAHSPFWAADHDALFQKLVTLGADDMSARIYDLLRNAPTAAPSLVRTLGDLAQTYLAAQRLGGTLHYELDLPEIDAPEAPMRAVLEHLVEGALRGNPSQRPYCHVGLVSEDDERVILSVRDNGIPLPECGMQDLRRFLHDTELRHVPDRVHRLFLADNLLGWMGGKISIAPTPGAAGTTVLVEIPKAARAKLAPALVGRHVF